VLYIHFTNINNNFEFLTPLRIIYQVGVLIHFFFISRLFIQMCILNGTIFCYYFKLLAFYYLLKDLTRNKEKKTIALTGNILLIFPWFLENLNELKKKK